MPTDESFWLLLEELVASSTLSIDRPAGSRHPRYPDTVYPLDYGYLMSTRSGDGDGIDVGAGSLPHGRVSGAIVTVDVVKRDVEVKVLLGCTPEEAQDILAFHIGGGQAAILFRREEERDGH